MLKFHQLQKGDKSYKNHRNQHQELVIFENKNISSHLTRIEAVKMIEKYLGYLMVNTGINKYFHICLLIIQNVQVFFLLIGAENLNNMRNVFLLSIIGRTPVILLFIVMEILLVGSLIIGGMKFKRLYRQNKMKKSYPFILVEKIIVYLIFLFKTILLLPIMWATLDAFKNSQDSIEIGLSILTSIIYYIIVVPIICIGYFNRIAIKLQTFTYPFFINLESLVYTYMHIYLMSNALLPIINPILHFGLFVGALVVIYWNSPSHYKHNQVIMYLYSLIAAFFLVSIVNYVNDDNVQNFGGCVLFVLSALCIAYLLYQFQQIITKQLLLNQIPIKQSPKWYQFDYQRNHNQIFLYHLLNYTKSIDQILIYFFEYQKSCPESEFPCKNIFNKLKEGESKHDLFSEIKQFFMKEVLKQYDPSEFETLGEMEIEKMIHQKGKLSLLIIQLMMIKDQDCIVKQNIRKCYYFLKQHEHLVMKFPSNYTFMAKIEIYGMLEILEDELTQTVKNESLTEKYHLKAHEYFKYQEKLQQFKKEISQVCDSSTQFWTEVSHDEVDCKKIKFLINKSHHHSCKVEKIFDQLMNNYKRSSIVIYDTLFHFSQLVLNCELSSTFNPFFSINTKYQQELELWKKENINQIDLQFTDTYDIPVCMVSAEKADRGSILWENSTFRQEYAFITEMRELTESKTINIDQLILPFYRTQHESLFDDFSQQESLRFDHGKTLIYMQKENHNVIEMQEIEVQILPSIKFGLKLLVFIKKIDHKHNQNQIKLLITDEKLETSFLSEKLVKEWGLNEKNDEMVHLIIENLFKNNSEWSNFLQDSEKNHSLKFDMEQSDYEAALIKTMRNEKGKRHFLFVIKDELAEETPYERALRENPHAASCLQAFMANTAKSLDSLRVKGLDVGNAKLMTQTQVDSFKIPFTMERITQEKSDQQILLQKIFQTMSQPTTPKKIITWRIITVIVIVLIMGTMIANMIITQRRQTVYKSDITTIQNYNLLIQYIGRSSITLRQYNYWAYTDISSPALPYYQKQLQFYQSFISSLLYSISGLMSDVWTAYDFQTTGGMSMVNQTQFVVVANYILSSVTYLADEPFQSFNFPFLSSEFFWFFGMTKAQANYLNNVYNSMYVALGNMLITRQTLAENVRAQIMDISSQLYIFPTIIGSVLLIFFIFFSFFIQTKSNKIIYDTSKLLEIITQREKRIQIEQIKKFQNIFLTNSFEQYQSKQTSVMDPTESHTTSIRQETMTESEYITDLQSPGNTTDRQLQMNKKNQNNADKMLNKHPLMDLEFYEKTKDKIRPRNSFILTNELNTNTVKISVESNNKLILLFYICVVTPFLAYFIGVLIGGNYLNSLIMQYIEFGSQMYHLCSYQQYIYLYSRETFLFQNPPTPDFSWGAVLIPGVLKIYDSSRYIDANFGFLDQKSSFAQLKLTLDKSNICNYLYLFEQQSIYYNITFKKSQCESIGNHIMTKGLKSAFVYFVEQSIQLLSSHMHPQTLTRNQRVGYLQGPQLNDMKKLLAYFEQFYKVLDQQFEQNMNNAIAYYIDLINIISIVLIFSLFLIVMAVHHRWTVMKKQAKQVQAILRLISFKHIKLEKKIRETFMAIDYHFYE